MNLNRLTAKAISMLSNLPHRKRLSSSLIYNALKKTPGMGSYLIQNVTHLKIAKKKSIETDKLVKEAYYQSIKFEHPYVGTEHLLLSLLKLTGSKDLSRVKVELLKHTVFPNSLRQPEKQEKTPLLSGFGENLKHRALKNLDQTLVMRSEYDLMVAALLQRNTSSVLLVGDPGIGKRTLIDLLARNITTLDVPPALAGYQVIEFDLLSFLTTTLSKGGLDVGLAALSDELKSSGRVILKVKNFQNLFFSTSLGMTMPMFYSLFKNLLDSYGAKMVATMNTALFTRISGENEHMLEGFTVVNVEEPKEKEAIKMLEANAQRLSDFHGVSIDSGVIKYIYKKARTSTTDAKFPQVGIDLLDRTSSYLVLKRSRIPSGYKRLVDKSFDLLGDMDESVAAGKYDQAVKMRNDLRHLENRLLSKEEKIFYGSTLIMTPADVDEVLVLLDEEPKIDFDKLSTAKLASLAETIKNKIIGQDSAVEMTVRSLIRSRLGLRTKKRTLGNFLFLGPTGVGKTELAKVVADEFYGEKSLIRLDMSDFSEKHTVARLVGAPPGYVGYGEGGELTTKIEAKPDSVVLFDEIEKAHPDVLNILLQIMEEAELTDARGNTFDFSKSIVILTSNLGTEIIHGNEIGFTEKQLDTKSTEGRLRVNMKKILKPELLNRFDEVIIFNQLKQNDQKRILDLLIDDCTKALKTQRVELKVNKKTKDHLLSTGYSEEYGARALRRTVERELLDPVAEFLLANRSRPLALVTSVENGKIVIQARMLK
jgi:ATP-dependent Clp protease ATP-binding subunit ClpC